MSAPVAFLAAVTIAVLAVRSGFGGGGSSAAPSAPSPAKPGTAAPLNQPRPNPTRSARASAAYYRIERGDTLDAVARRFGTSVHELFALNPGVEPTALHVGQRVRVR